MKTDNIPRIAHLLGLARRANSILCGSNLTISAIQSNKAMLTLISSDASDRTKKQLSDKCLSHNVKLVHLPLTSDEISHIVGKSSPVSVLAILDKNFASGIINLAEEQ